MCNLQKYTNYSLYHYINDKILCRECKKISDQKEDCLVCRKVQSEETLAANKNSMVRCTRCQRRVHRDCDPLLVEPWTLEVL